MKTIVYANNKVNMAVLSYYLVISNYKFRFDNCNGIIIMRNYSKEAVESFLKEKGFDMNGYNVKEYENS